ncbi:liprin-beta-1 [Teleopsis dalmanni]|uniref:liprin-beta-1 n=1 Tax=Teleopsis dalmanni TaxID=139649 RepID=UPI0018CE2E67|nr:liprin-beta-1 [Teleopsis dalmanni]
MQGIKTRATITAGAVPQQTKTTNATVTEASKMLEAALQQMDGIISSAAINNAGNQAQSGVTTEVSSGDEHLTSTMLPLHERNLISASNVLSTAKTLALALQQVGFTAPPPDPTTASIISDWLDTHIPRQDADERLRRLQRDKESLALQYQALVERVSEQADKIIELEGLLTDKTQQLSVKEEQLQRQMLSRSTLETQKLELMSALSELKLHRAALERENVELKDVELNLANLSTKSAPYGSMGNLNEGRYLSGAAPKTPPSSLRHQIQPQFHSLPRSHVTKVSKNTVNNNNNNRTIDANANSKRNVAFASNEKILIEDSFGGENKGSDAMYGSFISNTNSTPSPNLRERSAKGLRNIFGKLRRSNSGNLELPALEQAEAEFKRGGSRATAGGRIEWTTQTSQLSTSSKGYVDWTPQEVCNWLCDLGLGCYEDDCKKWLKSNPTVCFFTASPVDIEKELNLKSTLHRKKIMLAVDLLTGKEEDSLGMKAANLDVSWVMRWLDDIGLPQYKDTFLASKVDGCMLHRLTLEDLAQLQVSSCLHIASLRRGIQCMREMEWNPECLIRRSTVNTASNDADDNTDAEIQVNTNECVALWTAHRVMEWLRVADLSEYAPNLRGAGVHGALMLYEPRFNANLLADLLSIPPSKTLLRRHLATHFKELLGRDVIQIKRDAEAQPGYQSLTMTAKLKPPKKTQFSLKRRKSSKSNTEVEWTDYVCPMSTFCLGEQQNFNSSTTSSTSTNNSNSLHSN